MVTFIAGANNAPKGAPVVWTVMTHAELQRLIAGEPCVIQVARIRDTLEHSGFTLEQCYAVNVQLAKPGENEIAIATRVARELQGAGAEVAIVDRRAHGAAEN